MKKIIALLLTVVLTASVAIGGTVAYLNDQDEAVNVMTVGNVEIVQFERERTDDEPTTYNDGTVAYYYQPFTQEKKLYPAVIADNGLALDKSQWYRGDDYFCSYPYREESADNPEKEFNSALSVPNKTQGVPTYANTYFELVNKDSVGNYIDKIVSVTNAGDEAAYVRTVIAIPSGGWTFENFIGENSWLHFNYVADSTWVPYMDNKGVYDTNGDGEIYEYSTYWHWDNDTDATDDGKAASASEWDVVTGTDGTGVEINGVKYFIFVATYAHELPAPAQHGVKGSNTYDMGPSQTGFRSSPSLLGFYMDSNVDCDDGKWLYKNGDTETEITNFLTEDGNIEVLVCSQAVQSAGFADAWTALDAEFGDITADNHPWVN